MTETNDNGLDFQKMIKESSNHEWQYVIVYKLDRFSRNKYETAKYKKALKDISAESRTTRLGKKINYYKCISIKKYRNNCIKKTIRQDILEEYLLNTITTELSKQKVHDQIVKKLIDLQNTPKTNTNLNMLVKSKKQAETILNNIMSAVEIRPLITE